MTHTVVILDRPKRLRRTGFLKAVIEALLEAEDQPPSSIEVLVTDSEEVRRLNRDFRGVDAATDVLSFPSGDGPELIRSLGEIAICLPIAEEQAAARGVDLESELACLAVHGGLHLLGYEDDTDEGRDTMLSKMNAIVEGCGMRVVQDWGSIYAKN